MRTKLQTKLRSRVAAVVVAIVAGGVLALFAAAGPAVAFFSGGLLLDIQVESPATLVARGAAVDVPLQVTCNGPSADITVTVTQKSGSGVAEGNGFTSVGCTGASQQILVRATANSFGKAFKQGTAVATADISGCSQNFDTCGREVDSEVIAIQK
jgi:hypothetical protein